MAFPFDVLTPVADNSGAHRMSADKINTLRAITVGPTMLNAKGEGAVGDGVTDDTVALQNAINKLASDRRYTTLYIPTGIYNITGTLNLPLMYYKRIAGDSWSDNSVAGNRGGTVLVQSTDNIPILKTANENFNAFNLENLSLRFLNQQAAANTNAYGLMFSIPIAGVSFGWYRWVIEHIQFINCNVGMGFDPVGTGQYAFWGNRCRDLYFQSTSVSAINLQSPVSAGAETSMWDGITILNTGSGITTAGTAILIGYAEAHFYNLIIEDWVSTAAVSLMYVYGGGPVSIIGFHTERCTLISTQIAIQHGAALTISDWGFLATLAPGGGNVVYLIKQLTGGRLTLDHVNLTITLTNGTVLGLTSQDSTCLAWVRDWKDNNAVVTMPATGWDGVSPTQIVQWDNIFYRDLLLSAGSRIVSAGTVPTVGSPGAGVSAQSVIAGSTNSSMRIQATLTAVAPGVVVGVVTFGGSPLATAPKNVVCSLSAPTAGVAATPQIGADTYSTTGFTIRSYGPTTVTTGTYVINCWVTF